MEIITGDKSTTTPDPFEDTPWPYEEREKWELAYQKNITSGHTPTRLEYLYKRVKEIYLYLKKLEIPHFIEYNPYDDIYEVNPEFELQQKRLNIYKLVIKEAGQLLEYEYRKKQMFKASNGMSSNQIMGLLNSASPRPIYTVNKPQ
jgi:hypothetical protein